MSIISQLNYNDTIVDTDETIYAQLRKSTKALARLRKNGEIDNDAYITLISYSISSYIERDVENTINNYISTKFYKYIGRVFANAWR